MKLKFNCCCSRLESTHKKPISSFNCIRAKPIFEKWMDSNISTAKQCAGGSGANPTRETEQFYAAPRTAPEPRTVTLSTGRRLCERFISAETNSAFSGVKKRCIHETVMTSQLIFVSYSQHRAKNRKSHWIQF